MAQIDSSIYLQQKAPRIFGAMADGMEEGMKMSDLARKQKLDAQEQEFNSALKQSYTQDPTGKIVFDQNKMSELFKLNPQKANELQTKIAADKTAFNKQRMDEFTSKVNLGAQMLGGITDETSYQAARPQLIKAGIFDEHELPAQFDSKFIGTQRMRALSVKDMLTHELAKQNQDYTKQKDDRDFGMREKEFGLKKEENKAKLEELKIKTKGDSVKMASELRKERSSLPVTKATQEVAAAFNKIQSSAQNPSPAGDMAMIFNYMKLLDPGSTVREGEYATASQATNVPGEIINLYNKAKEGVILNPKQRQDFVTRAGGMYKSQLDQQRKIDTNFADLASQAGIDPKQVLLNFDANEAKAPSQWDEMTDDDVKKLYQELGGN
jgi:hypothetical protein